MWLPGGVRVVLVEGVYWWDGVGVGFNGVCGGS